VRALTTQMADYKLAAQEREKNLRKQLKEAIQRLKDQSIQVLFYFYSKSFSIS
jgi:hypothetical protein